MKPLSREQDQLFEMGAVTWKSPANALVSLQGHVSEIPRNEGGPTFIDLFAGCGGLSLGLELAGFRPLLFSELNRDAAATYLSNRRGHDIASYGDVYELDNDCLKSHLRAWREQGVEDVDLVCGGPPCQGYSGIGIRRTFKLERQEIPSNHLYLEMIRVIEAVRPKMFLFENVKGLMSGRWTADGRKGEIWEEVLSAFKSIPGYQADFALIQAKDYGVPQNRPRVLIVGVRRDIDWQPIPGRVANGLLPEPSGTAPNPIEVFGDLVDDSYIGGGRSTHYARDAGTPYQKRMRSTPDGREFTAGSTLTEQEYSDHKPQVVEKFQHMLDHGGEIPLQFRTKKFAQRVIPAEWGVGGPNITATSLPDDYVHYSQPRTLTVREWARLQAFPDWYQFAGSRTTGGRRRAGDPSQGIWDRDVPKYTQIGNAVPVLLAEKVGLHLLQFLR